MYCTQCGTRNPQNARYCKQCGRPIEVAPAEQPDASSPAPEAPSLAMRARQLRDRAERRLAAEELDAALDDAREAVELAPLELDALRLLARVHERRGEMGLAVAAAERVCELAPDGMDDRDRLVALRHGGRSLPRRLLGVRRGAHAVLFDSRGGAALAAMVVFAVVALAVTALLRDREGRSHEPMVPPPPPPALPAALAPPGAVPATTQPPVVVNPGVTVNQQGGAPAQGAAGWFNAPRPQFGPNTAGMTPVNPLAPAAVAAARPALESDPRFFPEAHRDPPAVHLPDAGDAQPAPGGGATPAGGAAAPAGGGEPRPDPGRMEIVVAPGTGPPGRSGGADAGPRNYRQIGQQLQLQGEHRQAIAAYLRALEGATEGIGEIHQRIALCHQHLGEKDAAARHFREAITAYQAQIAAGRDVDVARQGIRASELGLRVLQ
ncbi:MAG TPA: zinc ribbon domain-containing protein [Chthonomonadales bacterium]|nr:zinc ribbon domain-containing protein [Chthonomonadales bacterium]